MHLKYHRGGYKRKGIICLILAVLAVLLFGECTMRLCGFCQSPLYYNNDLIGYNLLPNQNVKRYGNSFITNEYSMRSDVLKENEFRITLVGDSVLNGGTQVDQTELASSKLERSLQDKYGENIRVLNVSAGGWGIDNAAGVFKQYGDFGSKMIVLVFNSHDAIGTLSETPVAGNSKSFPTKQYPLAWMELFDRYLIPKIQAKLKIKSGPINDTNTSSGDTHSEGWSYFYELCTEKGIDVAIYLHATQAEMLEGEYDENGRWIIDYASEKGIPLFQDIECVNTDDYRDGIHFSSEGQNVLYSILYPALDDYISKNYVDK